MKQDIIKKAIENHLVIKVRCSNRRNTASLVEMISKWDFENLYIASPSIPRYPIHSFVYFELAETEDLLLLLRKIKFTTPRGSALLILEAIELLTGENGLNREIQQLIRELSNKGLLSLLWLCFDGDKETESELFDLAIPSVDILG